MMRVRTTHKLGSIPSGAVREYPESQAQWLIDKGHAVALDEPEREELEPKGEESKQEEEHSPQEPADEGGKEYLTGDESLKELQAHADELGLATSGTKADLSTRINDHVARL